MVLWSSRKFSWPCLEKLTFTLSKLLLARSLLCLGCAMVFMTYAWEKLACALAIFRLSHLDASSPRLSAFLETCLLKQTLSLCGEKLTCALAIFRLSRLKASSPRLSAFLETCLLEQTLSHCDSELARMSLSLFARDLFAIANITSLFCWCILMSFHAFAQGLFLLKQGLHALAYCL